MSYLKDKTDRRYFDQFQAIEQVDGIVYQGIKNKFDTDHVNFTWTNTEQWYKILRQKLVDQNRRLKFPSMALSRTGQKINWDAPNIYVNTGNKYVLQKKLIQSPSIGKPAVWQVTQCDRPLFMNLTYSLNVVTNMQQDYNSIVQDVMGMFQGGRTYLIKQQGMEQRLRKTFNRYGVHIVITRQDSSVMHNMQTGSRLFSKQFQLTAMTYLYRNMQKYRTKTKNTVTFRDFPRQVINVPAFPVGGVQIVQKKVYVPNFIYSSASGGSITARGDGVRGAVYITDINPSSTGTVSNKVYQDSIVLKTFDTSTNDVTVSMIAMIGHVHYKPIVTINSNPVSNLTLTNGWWNGTVNISLTGSNIIAAHEDGASTTATANLVSGPRITNLVFTGGYPGSQTQLKSGDTFNILIAADKSRDLIQIYNYQATIRRTATLAGSSPYTATVTIANRGSGLITNQSAKVRLRGISGIYGDSKMTSQFGSGDGSATVNLNNDVPAISAITQSNITYPASQAALKDSQTASVGHTISPATGITVSYSSPNGDLSISNSSTYQTSKTVTRISGNYNIATNNITINVTKNSNAAVATRSAVVYVAHTSPTISMIAPYSRLRSSSAGTNYTITLSSTQNLYSAPSLSRLAASRGTWQGSGFAGSGTSWTRSLQVLDSDVKDTYTFGGLTATNLAGKVVNTITSGNNYILGGFVSRTITIARWPNREGSIGTRVSDTSKLLCQNNSKGVGYYITYQTSTADAVDKYTITQPTTVFNAAGNLWYNRDLANAVSNVLGLATVTIQETV